MRGVYLSPVTTLTRLDDETREALEEIVSEDDSLGRDDRVEILRALETDDEDEADIDEEQLASLRRCLLAADLDDDDRQQLLEALVEIED